MFQYGFYQGKKWNYETDKAPTINTEAYMRLSIEIYIYSFFSLYLIFHENGRHQLGIKIDM